MQRLMVMLGAVLLGISWPGCARAPLDPTRPSGPIQSRQFTGDLAESFAGVRTIAFADELGSTSAGSDPDSESISTDAAPMAEHAALRSGLRASVRQALEQAGYEWVEDRMPQRTIEVAVLLSTQDSLSDLERFYEIAPGYLDPNLSARGAIALAVSWPGRADAVWRGMIEDLADYGSPLEDRLAVLPRAVETLLADLPSGPVEPRDRESQENGLDGEAEESDPDEAILREAEPAPRIDFDRATGRP